MADDAGTGADSREGTQPEVSPQGGASNAAGKQFSQSDVDRLIGRTKAELKREFERQLEQTREQVREQSIREWRESQGLDEEALEKLNKAPNELEQVKRDLRVLKGSATKAENDLKAERDLRTKREAKLRDIVAREGVIKVAATLGAIDPQDVWALARDRVGHDETYSYAVVLDEKGEPTDTKLEDFISDLLKRKPHLAKPKGQSGAGSKPVQDGAQTSSAEGYDLSKPEERARRLRDLGFNGFGR